MARTTINTQVIPDGTIVSADLSYPLTDFSSTGIDDNATSTAMTIASSGETTFTGDVVISEATPAITLDDADNADGELKIVQSSGSSFYRTRGVSGNGAHVFQRNDGTDVLKIFQTNTSGDVIFYANDGSTEGMRWDASTDRLGIGTASPSYQLVVEGATGKGALEVSTVQTGELQTLAYHRSDAAWLDHTTRAQNIIFKADSAGATERMRIDSSGNVGIGTTSPNALLHVSSAGNGEIEVERVGGALINLQAQAGVGVIGTDSNHGLRLKTNAAVRATITASGSVGIGTTSPADELEIEGVDPAIRLDDTSAGGYARLEATNGSMVYEADQGNTVGNSTHIFKVDSTERVRIDSNGNVGIGESSPSAILHISVADHTQGSDGRSVRIDNDTTGRFGVIGLDDLENMYLWNGTNNGTGNIQLYTGGGTGTERVRLNSTGHLAVSKKATIGGGVTTTSPDAVFTVQDSGATVGQITAVFGADANSNSLTNSTSKETRIGIPHYNTAEEPAALIFSESTSTENRIVLGGGTSRMNAATSIAFRTAANSTTATGTERMRIDSSGNVGIGTTNPSEPLEINAGSTSRVKATDGSYNLTTGVWVSAPRISFGTPSSGNAQIDYHATANTLALTVNNSSGIVSFATNSTERMRIQPNGRVGIGTTNPSARFHLLDTTSQMGILGSTSASTYIQFRSATTTTRGYIGNGSGLVTGASNSDFIFRSQGDVVIATGGSGERVRVDTSGNIKYAANTYSAPKKSYAGTETLTYTSSTNGSSETQTATTSLPYQAIVPFSIYGSFSGSGANSFQYFGYIHNIYYGPSVQIVASDISHSPNIWNAFTFSLTGAWNARKLQVTLSNTASYNPAQTGSIVVYYHLSV